MREKIGRRLRALLCRYMGHRIWVDARDPEHVVEYCTRCDYLRFVHVVWFNSKSRIVRTPPSGGSGVTRESEER